MHNPRDWNNRTPDAPSCGGTHTCNNALFNILLNDVVCLEANLNNGIGTTIPSTSLFGIPNSLTSIVDRHSQNIISQSLSNAVLAARNGSDSIKIVPHPSNIRPHKDVTWVRLLDPNGNIVFSSCIGVEATPPSVPPSPTPEPPQPSPAPWICGPTPSGSWVGHYKLCNTHLPSIPPISGIYVNNTFLPAPTGSGNYGYHKIGRAHV